MSVVLNKTFKGKFVRVLSTKHEFMQNEDQSGMVPVPQAYQGIFVDSDENFVILGEKVGKKLVGKYAVSLNTVEDVMFADETEEEHLPLDIPPIGELN
jgi:hypothetical protein